MSFLHSSLKAGRIGRTSWHAGLASVLLVGLLAGCGSSVKLDEGAPVSDRTAVSVGTAAGAQAGGAASSGGVNQRGVTGVETGAQALAQPPQNLSRVIYFDYDDFAVRGEFTAVLEAHARFLNADRQRHVVLEGHTDERGGREYNLALGQKRADAVRRTLSLLGVADSQLESVSFGKEKPANAGTDEEAFRQNRRVELNYR